MKNDSDLDSVDPSSTQTGDGGRTSSDEPAPRSAGAERAFIAQVEISEQREIKARRELQRVRADGVRSKKSFELLLDDGEKRSLIQLEIHRAEKNYLQRIITDLEASSRKAKAAIELQREESSALNTRLLLQVSELEAHAGNLKAEVLRLKNEVASYSKTMVKKESFGRDKARRLDTALDVLAQERSKIKSLQKSSSMRIGRLVTSSLKNPWATIALIWRLPRAIYAESKLNIGGREK